LVNLCLNTVKFVEAKVINGQDTGSTPVTSTMTRRVAYVIPFGGVMVSIDV